MQKKYAWVSLSAAEQVKVETAQEYEHQDRDQKLVVAIVVRQEQDDQDQEDNIVLLKVPKKRGQGRVPVEVSRIVFREIFRDIRGRDGL